jgi:hypothetical protein
VYNAFFLILICPEHKVFPCEVIYMIVSFYFTHLEVHILFQSGAKRFFILVQSALLLQRWHVLIFKHHMKIAQYNWIEYKTGNNLVLSAVIQRSTDTCLIANSQCNDRYVSSVGASTKIRNGFKSLVLSQVLGENIHIAVFNEVIWYFI